MKIALFSDIHANLPALEAFFNDVEIRNPDSIYCLGDLVGYNIWPTKWSMRSAKGKYQQLLEIMILALDV